MIIDIAGDGMVKLQTLFTAVQEVIGSQDDNVVMPPEYWPHNYVAVSREAVEKMHDAMLKLEKP